MILHITIVNNKKKVFLKPIPNYSRLYKVPHIILHIMKFL